MAEAAEERPMIVPDPACGMQVDIDKVAAWEEHGGWAYFFCATQCYRLFRTNPERYVTRAQPLAVSSSAKTERGDHGQS